MKSRFGLLFIFALTLFANAQVIQKQWVETNNWHGFGTLSTETFKVFGKQWRVRYKTLNNGSLNVTLKEAETEQATAVVQRKSGRSLGFEQYAFSEGEKYLFIQGNLGGWRVSVEQFVDSVEEWNSLRYLKNKPALEMQAAWSGETSRDIPCTTSKPWKLDFEQMSDGLIRIQILDATGAIHFDSMTSKAGTKGAGWVYAPGTFTIKITTSDVAWRISSSVIPE